MKVFWRAKKRGRDGRRYYTGLMIDENFYIHKFYYTTRAPKFIRIAGVSFGTPSDPYCLSVETAKRKIFQNGYSPLDKATFETQCPEFNNALGEYLIVRKLKYGV